MPKAAADGQCQKCAAAWLADRRDVTTAYALGISTPGPSMWEEPPPCSYTDPEIFFADAGTHDEQHAIRMCTSCPVRALCLAYALHLEQGAATTGRRGIWAGTSPRDLGLVLTGEPRAAIQHGRNPILTLTCDVRDATDREAHDLAHRDDEHDEEVAA